MRGFDRWIGERRAEADKGQGLDDFQKYLHPLTYTILQNFCVTT